MQERVVALVVAPVGMRQSADYEAALKLAQKRHPNQRIVSDAELWSTSKEFAKTYKKLLGSFEVRDFYILTAPDGTVGYGIFKMWRYLSEHQKSKTTALFPTGEAGYFEEIEESELSVISDDMGRYAVPVVEAPKGTV